MNSSTVSVIIPAYKAMATIDTAISSVRAQTVAPIEIIVVDDGSPDSTAELVRSKHPDVRVIQQENQGCGMARNTGARAASGEWLAFLDADDAWLPEKLERQLRETQNPQVAVVACLAVGQRNVPYIASPTFDDLWECNRVIVSSALVRRSVFDEAGAFWSRRACEDYHMWLRLAGAGWLIVNCPEELVVYSPTASSLSRQVDNFANAELACIQDIAERLSLPQARRDARMVSSYTKHARGAIHVRALPSARRFIMESLRYGLSFEQLYLLGVACAPVALLDLRQRLVSGQRIAERQR